MMSSILMRTPRMFSPLSTPSFATDCHAAYVLDTLRHVDDDVWASTLRCIAPDLACVIGIPVVLLNENMSTSFDIRVGTAPWSMSAHSSWLSGNPLQKNRLCLFGDKVTYV